MGPTVKHVNSLAAAVEVELQGSLTVGADVAEFLKHHLENEPQIIGRRSMTNALEELQKVVRLMKPCKNITAKICSPKLERLVLDFASDLTLRIKTIFDDVLDDEPCKIKYFQKCLKHVKKAVREASSDTNEVYRWINVLKKISGIFLEQGILLIKQGVDDAEQKKEATNVLKQQLVLKITNAEHEYQTKFCRDLNFCPYQYDVTIHLQLLLNLIKTMNDTSAKLFLNQFKKHFLYAPMFEEDEIMKENFERVLKEMLLNKAMAVKDIMLSISDVVQKRLVGVEATETDAVILQMILSDMDHIYVSNKDEHIEKFMDVVKTWLRDSDDTALGDGMAIFYNSLEAHFLNQPSEIIFKLKTETQVFLGLIANYTPPKSSEM